MTRYFARFQAQETNPSGEVYNVGCAESWDVTDYVGTLRRSITSTEFERLFEPDTYESDRLREDSNAPEWVREWDGPFYCTLEEWTDSDLKRRLARCEAGDECPVCRNGTVEIVSEVTGEKVVQMVANRETRCKGECGAIAPTHPSIKAGPGYNSLADTLASELGGEGFTVADMLTVRNLVKAFEEHLSQEAHSLGVSTTVLCPCTENEVKAARELLFRLDPLMEV